jgi:hypothetical protein
MLRALPVTGDIVRRGTALEEIQGMISFVGGWDAGSRYSVLNGARTVAEAMGRASGLAGAQAYQRTIGRLAFVRKPPGTVNGWAWTRASARREVWVDAVGTAGYLQWGEMNTVHELGHAFAQLNPGTYGALRGAEIRNLGGKIIAGGSAGEHGRTLHGYADCWGDFSYARYFAQHGYDYASTWPWTQNPATVPLPGVVDPVHEDFADMMLGWAFNHFADDALGAGAARHEWMTTNMAEWIGG